jgi:Uma2 family endonuclease
LPCHRDLIHLRRTARFDVIADVVAAAREPLKIDSMATAAPELPKIHDQTAFNLKRWEELCADPVLAALDFRIETDPSGQIIMTPPAAPEHGEEQSLLVLLLHQFLPEGIVLTECPVSTSGGVKAIDVAWISVARRRSQRGKKALAQAPEICVEVLSPSNSRVEIDDKRRLYFEAGAEEVWICGLDGSLRFFGRAAPETETVSTLCPDFPKKVEIDSD